MNEAFVRILPEADSKGIVHQPVQDNIGNDEVTDVLVPVLNGQLCGDNSGCRSVAVFDDITEIPPFLGAHGREAQIVKDKDLGFGQVLHDLGVIAGLRL
jgi:hypothetical protein